MTTEENQKPTNVKRYWCQVCGTWVLETELKFWPAGGSYDGIWLLLCPGCDSELDRRDDNKVQP